jgi:hypothetical protein
MPGAVCGAKRISKNENGRAPQSCFMLEPSAHVTGGLLAESASWNRRA